MDNMLKDCKTYYGAIDIGSNAVRLLIKCVEEDEQGKVFFSKVLLLRVPLRLGFDVFAMGKISETKEKNMLRLMKVFHHLMKIYDVEDYRACATSAMRDAKNGKDIIKRIKKKTGIRIEIIDGQEEAKMIYNNHIECMEDCNGNYMYVDVGGGSTEINLLSQGELVCSRSYNIGTVRILNNAVKETEWERKRKETTDAYSVYEEIIKDNIEYDHFVRYGQVDKDRLDEIVSIILETVCSKRKTIRIAGDDYPAELVKAKFMKLNSSHIEFVFDCMKENTTKIRNIKQYLKAVLFNAPNTIDSYYTALVNHD